MKKCTFSLSLSLSLLLIVSGLRLNAQTLKVPGGTVGNSGNSNVGINVTTPSATLDVGGTTATGAFKITTTNATGMGAPGQEPIYTTPYALRVDFNETVYQPTGVKTTALLTHLGQWYLGDFNGAISGNHFINTKGNGIAVHGVGQNKLMFTYNGTHGNLISWETSNTSSTTRNLSFSYGGNSPFFYLIPEGKVAIATTNTPGDYKLYVGGKAIVEEVVVKLQTNWPDYVFSTNYKMLSNLQLRNYIAQNGKLPYLPAAQEVADKGLAIGATQVQLTRLVEALTLRLLEMEERIVELESQLAKQ